MKTIQILNTLIQINNDRIAGYIKAAWQTSDEDLLSLFTGMASQSRQFINELRQFVKNQGDQPAKGTTLIGKIYRFWMELKAIFRGDSRKSLLTFCEYGEHLAQRTYNSVLKRADVTKDIRFAIETQKFSLQESHEKIKVIRDAQPA